MCFASHLLAGRNKLCMYTHTNLKMIRGPHLSRHGSGSGATAVLKGVVPCTMEVAVMRRASVYEVLAVLLALVMLVLVIKL